MVLIMFVFFFGIYRSGDDSMNPAVKDGDIVITWRLRKDYRFGDVIVLDHNGEKEICTLEAIHVAPINNVKTMKPDESMCSSYKYEQ